jgi:hypothetical protein
MMKIGMPYKQNIEGNGIAISQDNYRSEIDVVSLYRLMVMTRLPCDSPYIRKTEFLLTLWTEL